MPTYSKFFHYFFLSLWHVRFVILVLLALMVAGGAAVAFVEKMPFADTLYFALITGLAIGYGDIVVVSLVGRALAVLIGFIGVVFTGLIVAVAVHALQECGKEVEE
jgi:voltage-gated potassium channel